jgi:hypothetical protein
MPKRRPPPRTPPVVFGEAAWAADWLRASATRATRGYQHAEGLRDDLPAPDGPRGMVFEIERIGGRLRLLVRPQARMARSQPRLPDLNRIAVALLGSRPQILDRTFEPLRGHIAKPKAVIRLNLLTTAATSEEPVAQRTSGRDAAVDVRHRCVPEPSRNPTSYTPGPRRAGYSPS